MECDWRAAHTTLLEALDAAPCGPKVTFRAQEGKEAYETLLTFVLRRIAGAEYHKRRIEELVDQRANRELPLLPLKRGGTGRRHAAITFSDESHRHELAAFLASLKSASDFLATLAFRFHIRGEEGDSVTNLLRRIERGASGPIDTAVRTNADWLTSMRAYRDELVHTRAPGDTATYEAIAEGGCEAEARAPIVVPRETTALRGLRDTRRSRMECSQPLGVMRLEFRGTVSTNGATTVERLGIQYRIEEGFVRIEDFATEHLEKQRGFLRDMCLAFSAVGFRIPMGRGQ